jgi:hypothetical protein
MLVLKRQRSGLLVQSLLWANISPDPFLGRGEGENKKQKQKA